MIIHCDYRELVSLETLKPHPKNRNKHPKDQIKRLAKALQSSGWRHPVIVSRDSGFIVAGHGRVEAARLAGFKEVPVDYQSFDSPEKEYEFLISDNAIALWAELDLEAIAEDLKLMPTIDFEDMNIEGFEEVVGSSSEDPYTKKIQAPIYEPKGDKPKLADLCDTKKSQELLKEIQALEAPEDVKHFLSLAAGRHTVFNYAAIAEFYCHAPKEVQALMEKSALVIIDFNKAIENGFVSLTNEIAGAYSSEG